MNKTIEIRGQKYQMYQVRMTNWVFVRSNRGKSHSFPIAQIFGDEVGAISSVDQLRDVSNQELIDAWLSN